MYHIQKDIRAQKSAKLIGEGMLKCLGEKRFEEISVSDVQRASSVGRSTFYRLFDNTADVLAYLCDGIFEQANREYAELCKLTADETTLRFIRIWMEHQALLQAIVDSGRTEFLHAAHMKYLAPNTTFFPGTESMDRIQVEYLMTTLTSCIAAFLSVWVKSGGKETAEQHQTRIKICFHMLGLIFEEKSGSPHAISQI